MMIMQKYTFWLSFLQSLYHIHKAVLSVWIFSLPSNPHKKRVHGHRNY